MIDKKRSILLDVDKMSVCGRTMRLVSKTVAMAFGTKAWSLILRSK